MSDPLKVHLGGFDVEWDLEKGLNLWAGIPTLSMWIPSTVAGMMRGIQAMVGTERFHLWMVQGGVESVDGDWSVISSQPSFEEGIQVMSGIAASAGWGRWEIVSLDREKKRATMRSVNSWEGKYQRELGVRWGSGMMGGKFAGLCSRLFNTPCWPEQTVFSADQGDIDEFEIAPSLFTPEQRLELLIQEGRATSSDLQAALARLRAEMNERMKIESELRETLALVDRQQSALRLLETPIIQVWEGVLAVPLVGALDGHRTSMVTERLLTYVVENRTRHVIIDLTGVEMVDTSTADHLLKIVSAVQMLGARVWVTGIRPAVAQTIVSLGLDLTKLETKRNLQEALKACMK
ncbi:MAG: STAS domain-containing protein [Polyangiaceae bacterium]